MKTGCISNKLSVFILSTRNICISRLSDLLISLHLQEGCCSLNIYIALMYIMLVLLILTPKPILQLPLNDYIAFPSDRLCSLVRYQRGGQGHQTEIKQLNKMLLWFTMKDFASLTHLSVSVNFLFEVCFIFLNPESYAFFLS